MKKEMKKKIKLSHYKMRMMLKVHFYHEWDRILIAFQEERQLIKKYPFIYNPVKKQANWPIPLLCELLIHFRNINEFFHGNFQDKRNANVKHYILSWNKKLPKKQEIWKKRIHKFLAHLSYSRQKWKPWPIENVLYSYYKNLTIEFIDSLHIRTKHPLFQIKARLIQESGHL